MAKSRIHRGAYRIRGRFGVDGLQLCIGDALAFDLVGHLLCCLPYLFFRDYTDEKHAEVMQALSERADAAELEAIKEKAQATAD